MSTKTIETDIHKLSKLDRRKRCQPKMTKITQIELETFSIIDSSEKLEEKSNLEDTYEVKIYWENVIFAVLGHIAAVYGIYLIFTSAKYQTTLWATLLHHLTGFGITAGAHRLWSHHSYKAKLPLRVLLIIFHSMAFQFTMFDWVRDHRVHHKFVDTNADPYNAKRGFFFSHMGWLLCRMHPDALKKRRSIDMKDLLDDPIVQFQKRYFLPMLALWCFVVPTMVPMYFWGETLNNAFHVAVAYRGMIVANLTSLINSAGHYWGSRPYNKFITPTDNPKLAVIALGDSWHNYHHTFPWDYKSAELAYCTNLTTAFIEFFAKIGWAYDLKTASPSLIDKRAQRTGDNTYNTNYAEIWESCHNGPAKV